LYGQRRLPEWPGCAESERSQFVEGTSFAKVDKIEPFQRILPKPIAAGLLLDFRRKRLEYVGMTRPSNVLLPLAIFCVVILPPMAHGSPARPPLIPQPREFEPQPNVSLAAGVNILVPGHDSDDRFAAADLASELKERGIRIGENAGAMHICLLRDSSPLAQRVLSREKIAMDDAMRAEGYILLPGPHESYIVAHTGAGVFYGVQTMKQLIKDGADGSVLLGCKIRDWPAMRYRGVHDDLSRGPVPTLEFQKKQIRTFAAYKINVYSPYFENTMQYASNPLPALPGGSISLEDAKALVAYARPYHVTIIPEQEAFGHLHKVLA
jgi:hypothetical protein